MTTPKTASELLPCPFCGEKRICLNGPSNEHLYGCINCPACMAFLPGAVSDEAELIACWNSRPRCGVQTGDAWQLVETAPKDTTVLLAWLYDGVWEIKSGWAGSTRGGWLDGQATHWQPLPAPPSLALPSAEPLPAKPEPARWPAKGDTMTFIGKNGYPYQLEAALKIFTPGEKYRVHDCEVGDFSHSIEFVGVKGRFNGVMFERAPSLSSTHQGSENET